MITNSLSLYLAVKSNGWLWCSGTGKRSLGVYLVLSVDLPPFQWVVMEVKVCNTSILIYSRIVKTHPIPLLPGKNYNGYKPPWYPRPSPPQTRPSGSKDRWENINKILPVRADKKKRRFVCFSYRNTSTERAGSYGYSEDSFSKDHEAWRYRYVS